jgi:hypothetical protein
MKSCFRRTVRALLATTLTSALTFIPLLSAGATNNAQSCGAAGYNGPHGCVLLNGSTWAGPLASLGDLNVYNNGTNLEYLGPDHGYSWQYQCTELAIRYAAIVWHEGSNFSSPEQAWNKAGWSGSAVNMWQVASKLAVPLQKIPNGSGAPHFGDLIIFSGATVGHVGVVVKVSSGRLYFVGENQASAPAEAWIPINSSNVASPGGDFSNTLQPVGWLRGPASGDWAVKPTQAPKVAAPFQLDGVSCSSASSCMAVGSYTSSVNKNVATVERWNGNDWTSQTPAIPSGATSSSLLGISCASRASCMAVGTYTYRSGDIFMLGDSWNGNRWSVTAIPPLIGSDLSTLRAVSCPSATYCLAVGDGASAARKDVSVSEHWNGSSWSLLNLPIPSGATYVKVMGVSCSTASACTAVGSVGTRDPSSGAEFTLADRWNGAAWAPQVTANPGGFMYRELQSVSCPTSTFCMAVGNITNSAGENSTLSEQFGPRGWTIAAAPKTPGQQFRNLFGVSCTSSKNCVAVGYNQNSPQSYVPISDGWNGTVWQSQTSPAVPGDAYAELFGVSCSTTTSCAATGYNVAENE